MTPRSTLIAMATLIILLAASGCSGASSSTPPPAPSVQASLPARATAARATAAPPTPFPLIAGTSQPGLMVRVWSSMCVEGVPYTLLSAPLDAKVELVQAQAQAPVTGVPVTGATAAPSAIPTVATPGFVGATAGPSTSPLTPQGSNGTAIVPATGLGVVPTQNSCTLLGPFNGLQMVLCTGPQGSGYTLYARTRNSIQVYQGSLWDCVSPENTPTALAMPTLLTSPAPTSAATQQTTLPPTLPPTIQPPTLPPTMPPTIPPTEPPTASPGATPTP